ncbi:MAG: bifunctional (p)ppGpp synthetase/guanosine-3',5'-bis(diphosphate) 3'-pyrophosphohydrolase [Porticoccus sp.]|uniref:RelA/SpoT family protein n=1 Tax=Porticoccus hydrocarbonoclasticus TaxID=1073414 RepID=UPI00055BEB16|nr:bifunctional (p)ppGpp synthetase/guanosine-3',5'-bis(diphosphate) 3'-pyrophosphohydrolase [Porticoccus hydrocarbonoclasticus]MBG56871.1 bifunctional (p)ppGpp synthetase/guanosine-3',5'-bis(diphosphate) 3'-pyrophosphohydrolase [Porticoccus sp.]
MQAVDALSNKLSSYLEQQEVQAILDAYQFATGCHEGQLRQSGEPYISHPLAVANILADMHLDAESLMAAMLHDVIEDTGVSKEDLAGRFGSTVAELVDGVSKLTEIEFASRAEQQAENFQKMTLAMARDIRVMLVKLADRLHNMRTLKVLSAAKRRRIARETLDIYAPIAQRLGINDIRVEFEDLGFAAMYPMRHQRLRAALKSARGNRKHIVEEIKDSIEIRLDKELISAEVTGREKHLWSIYQKMKTKRKSFRDIMDVFAFRIVVETVDDCYRTLGVIHNLFKPVPGEFKDYVAIPKVNGYQSLHTVLIGMHGVPIEVQIRTRDMDAMANFGIAAHWLYKSREEGNPRTSRWVQGLLEIQQKAGNSLEFIEHVKADLFPDEVYVFTPGGQIISLPSGATPVDFAYAVHTNVGNTCVASKINGQLTSLSEPLQSGCKVTIINAKDAQPNPSWLNFVVTAKARSAIRHFLKHQQHEESVDLGKRLLDRALETFGSNYKNIRKSWIKRLLVETGAANFEEVLEQIGLGNRLAYGVANLMAPPSMRKTYVPEEFESPIMIDTSDGLIISYARCCHPIPGDPILGHLSPGRGLVVHRESCKNLNEIRTNVEKCMALNWSPRVKGDFSVEFKVELTSERGIIAALAARISESEATIQQISIKERDAHSSVVDLVIDVKGRIHLANVMRKIRNLKQVQRVYRTKN